VLAPAEAAYRFPMLTPGEDETVYFEPGAGVLFPERCVAAQIDLARRAGAVIRTGETALEIVSRGRGVTVVTDLGAYDADQVVVAAGPWAGPLLGGRYVRRLSTYRQVMHWFEPLYAEAFAPERFPVFIWMHGAAAEDWFYGFPLLPGKAGVKIADERFDSPLPGPEAQSQIIDPGAAEAMRARHVRGRVAGVGEVCTGSRACLYTMAPQSRFLIGRDPEREAVIVVSACSGHGFKHSAAIGDLVAELALDAAPPPLLAPFALDEVEA
jgi:sarcosine oxidase